MKYCSHIKNACILLGNQMHMHNPTQPLAIYRQSGSTSFGANFGDLNLLLMAYYSMVDELQANPLWQRKVGGPARQGGRNFSVCRFRRSAAV